jgi:ATP-dependent Zn protease
MSDRKRLEAAAYHEAGHAVVAWRQRVKVPRVTILHDDDSVAGAAHSRRPAFLSAASYDSLPKSAVEDHALVCLAGAESEKRWTGRYNHVGARSDVESAVAFLRMHAGSDEEVRAWMKLQQVRTRQVVTNMWSEIAAAAKTLVERRAITHAQIAGIVDEFLRIEWPSSR